MSVLEYRKMDEDEVRKELEELGDWSVEGGRLQREFSFDSYLAGIVFSTAVAHLAESMDHHPDIHIGYQRVRISVNTHAVKGLSPYDFALAQRVDQLIKT